MTILDRWKGFSLPSPPVAVVTVLLVGAVYTLVVAGAPRRRAKVVLVVLVAVYSFARLYLAVDHPFDVLVAIALAAAIPVNAFRFFTPNEVFPVTYHKGKTAHLDVTGARGDAIREALRDQLGLTVLDLKPVGLAGSGGSTPLRLRVAGDPDEYLFGKLYAMSHVRADRWYKMGRTVLYGRLEDEAPFQSVRRLVEYEDYALRLVRDAGIHTAAAYGIVEMTPEREYLLVTEFFDGATEIGDVDVDDEPHRPGTAAGPPALGRRPGPSRHQAGQPAGPGRRAAAHRRGVRAGATVAVAAGRRPGQHDARPRGPIRQPSGSTTGRSACSPPRRSPRRSPPPAAWPARRSCGR